MIFSVFSTVEIILLGICSGAVSEDTDWIISTSQGLILPLMIKTKSHSFTIEQIKKKCEKEEFISNSEGYHFDESKFDDFDTAKTVYIGAGKSGLSYRFYDKDKEVCSKHNKTLEEVGSWKRTEMQLRDDKAHAFAMTFKDRPLELGELAFGLLANNLRFVVPNRNESNKSRWKTCRFWERFLGAVEVLNCKYQNSKTLLKKHSNGLQRVA